MSLAAALASARRLRSSVARFGRRRTLRVSRVEQQRRKRGDAGEAGALAGVDAVGDRHDVGGFEPAFMTAIEDVALGAGCAPACPAHARAPARRRRPRRLFDVEDRPVVRLERRGRRAPRPSGSARDGRYGRPSGRRGACPGTGHVDRDRLADAAAQHRRGRRTLDRSAWSWRISSARDGRPPPRAARAFASTASRSIT